jgi:hypothetical protein
LAGKKGHGGAVDHGQIELPGGLEIGRENGPRIFRGLVKGGEFKLARSVAGGHAETTKFIGESYTRIAIAVEVGDRHRQNLFTSERSDPWLESSAALAQKRCN